MRKKKGQKRLDLLDLGPSFWRFLNIFCSSPCAAHTVLLPPPAFLSPSRTFALSRALSSFSSVRVWCIEYSIEATKSPIVALPNSNLVCLQALVATADRERQLAELAAQSPSPIVFEKVYPDFSHITWFTGKDSAAPWLDDLVTVLARYNPVN